MVICISIGTVGIAIAVSVSIVDIGHGSSGIGFSVGAFISATIYVIIGIIDVLISIIVGFNISGVIGITIGIDPPLPTKQGWCLENRGPVGEVVPTFPYWGYSFIIYTIAWTPQAGDTA